MAKKKLDTAIEQLASLFEFGQLDLATDPVVFIDRVRSEIIRLRKIEHEEDAAFFEVLKKHTEWDGESPHPYGCDATDENE